MKKRYQNYKILLWVIQAASTRASQGFSLGEVLIASVISALFFLVSLQSTLLGGQYQRQALDTSQFNRLVQSDLEQSTLNQSSRYNLTRLGAATSPGNTAITVTSVESFPDPTPSQPPYWIVFADDFNRDTVIVDPSVPVKRDAYKVTDVNSATRQITLESAIKPDDNYAADKVVIRAAEQITSLASNASLGASEVTLADASALAKESELVIGDDDTQIYTVMGINTNVVKIQPPLKSAKYSGAIVGAFRCQAKTRDRGFAAGLRTFLGSTDTTETLTRSNQYGVSFSFQRTMSIINQAPFNLLRVGYVYEVRKPDGSPETITLTTDVIPTASLYCS